MAKFGLCNWVELAQHSVTLQIKNALLVVLTFKQGNLGSSPCTRQGSHTSQADALAAKAKRRAHGIAKPKSIGRLELHVCILQSSFLDIELIVDAFEFHARRSGLPHNVSVFSATGILCTPLCKGTVHKSTPLRCLRATFLAISSHLHTLFHL